MRETLGPTEYDEAVRELKAAAVARGVQNPEWPPPRLTRENLDALHRGLQNYGDPQRLGQIEAELSALAVKHDIKDWKPPTV